MSADEETTDELNLALDRHAAAVVRALTAHTRALREHTAEMSSLRRALDGHADTVEHALRRGQ